MTTELPLSPHLLQLFLQTGPVTIKTDYSAPVKQHAGLKLQADFRNVSVVYCGAIVPTTILIQFSGANASYVVLCNNSTHQLIIHLDDRTYNEECQKHLETFICMEIWKPSQSKTQSIQSAAIGGTSQHKLKNILNALINLFAGILKFILYNPLNNCRSNNLLRSLP
jgi:hypothetical protein